MIKVTLCLIFLVMTTMIHGYDRLTGEPFASRSEVIGQNGMVATSHPLATQIGLDILKNGGNAIDAAIAANIALGLMEPTGNGIGGDLFAIVWSAKDKKLYGLNASGPAPQDISIDYIKSKGLKKIPSFGPLPVSVPGAVDGWIKLHERFGNIDFKNLFDPTIKYAQEGFPVTETIAYYFERSKSRYLDFPNFKETWMQSGDTPKKGEIFKNLDLAKTLEEISKTKRKSFYEGRLAKEIARFIKDQGGFLSFEDMSNYQSEWVEPVSSNYRGYDVWELPPNGQGIAALQILNILEGFDLKAMGLNSAEYVHHFVEAKKIAFADRAKYYADPKFNNIDIKYLISKEYAELRRKEINSLKASQTDSAGILKNGDTIYLTTADKDGNMVSLIQSNYRGMGSGMIPNNLGFMLQDRGELFSLNSDHANSLMGGKRPFHTIIPAFVTKDGEPFLSFGVMGGATQPQAHAQIMINLIDFEMNLQEAGDAPRIVHSGSSQPTDEQMLDGGYISLESGFKDTVIDELEKMGHTIKYDKGVFGGYQAIMKINNVYFGASESRKDGQASGY
ncbi:gamma-glutamyltransferase [Gammaproteobacteria bacterium]|nr:gamma-glutamyltransferase [Gammaproteobacteria bacterium]